MRRRIDMLDDVARVVSSGNCSGCGACTLIDSRLTMRESDDGFLRPVPVRDGDLPQAAGSRQLRRTFRATCPGVQVRAQRPAGAQRDQLIGPVLAIWSAWASDPELRHRGSSGGVLTALASWLAESGQSAIVVGASADANNPRRTVPLRITSRNEALAASGSRYAPVAMAAETVALSAAATVIGKPCEASAVRALHEAQGTPPPLILSFFCAGTPSQDATERLVRDLGVPAAAPVKRLWYRGHGWPGAFTVETAAGQHTASYEESWGQVLGRSLQWRCKICPDGVGESSDITAADLWESDERGYPAFAEKDGRSALIARTERGLQVITAAMAAGVIAGQPVSPIDLSSVQPLQRQRRTTLAGRLVGTVLAGRSVPRYRGFGLVRLAARQPRETWRTGRGTHRRVRSESI